MVKAQNETMEEMTLKMREHEASRRKLHNTIQELKVGLVYFVVNALINDNTVIHCRHPYHSPIRLHLEVLWDEAASFVLFSRLIDLITLPFLDLAIIISLSYLLPSSIVMLIGILSLLIVVCFHLPLVSGVSISPFLHLPYLYYTELNCKTNMHTVVTFEVNSLTGFLNFRILNI